MHFYRDRVVSTSCCVTLHVIFNPIVCSLQSNWNDVCESFDAMDLKDQLLRGIYAYGFERPSAIQQRAIIPCIKGHDVIAQAQSGTGKTATFSIAILQQLDIKLKDCQALVLAPTRELAQQVRDIKNLCIFKKDSIAV